MTILIVFGWWFVGFIGALVGSYVLPGGDGELTYGRAFGCALWGIFGPLTALAAFIWSACFFVGEGHGHRDGFLNKPIFRRDDSER